jgi:hypothetical protein
MPGADTPAHSQNAQACCELSVLLKEGCKGDACAYLFTNQPLEMLTQTATVPLSRLYFF